MLFRQTAAGATPAFFASNPDDLYQMWEILGNTAIGSALLLSVQCGINWPKELLVSSKKL